MSYERHKQQSARRAAESSQQGRDIGKPPAVVDRERRERGESDFRFFCESFFPQTFHLPWSGDHLKVIAKIEQAVLRGGLFAVAMPRGSGKSTLAECASIWALLYGHRDFVCLIGSDEGHAVAMLDSIKSELENNELLFDDFPEVCYPIVCLEGIANRCSGQLCEGERTQIDWRQKEIVLPTIKGSRASGGVVRVAGITGRIRGMKFKRPDGKSVRPSLVIIDDPQTDESARSAQQCATRESVLAGAILGLAGPGKKISGIMPCTVIHPGDMADNILNQQKHPEWNGERTKMVYAFPTNDKAWQDYGELRAESLRLHGDIRLATAHYKAHRAELDAGAVVAWPERYNHDELSAIQHAMNLKLQDEAAFFAEYQNEPLLLHSELRKKLTADDIAAKLNGHDKGVVPLGATHLTAFIDVQQDVLFYAVAAWGERFTGWVIDYGTFPEQGKPYFTLRDIRPTLSMVSGTTAVEGAVYAGLTTLVNRLLATRWKGDGGSEFAIDRLLIDANWGTTTDVIYQFCRQSEHAARIMPSHGRFVGAGSVPFSEYQRRPGERVGMNWRIPSVVKKRSIRHIIFDTNYWKSFIHTRFAVAMGEHGCLSVFGHKSYAHRLFADHIVSEYSVITEGRGRTVEEWKLPPTKPDNHWLDCMVGAAVAASLCGVSLEDGAVTQATKAISFAECRKNKKRR